MADVNGPLAVRHTRGANPIKPGLHSYNASRRAAGPSVKLTTLRKLQAAFFVLGFSGISYYAYALSDQYIYQAFENWAFEQQIAGRPAVTFADYVRERTPFAFLAGATGKTSPVPADRRVPGRSTETARPADGAVLGRVEIERLHLAAMVREGVSPAMLSMAVGHVPTTALPGQAGNFAIAAHRDTLFRALKDIKKNDLVRFQSQNATYTYEVVSTKIVKPSDVSVLDPDGGGIARSAPTMSSGIQDDSNKLLTMITCYPFYYVGAAPKRFIVQARLVSSDPAPKLSPPRASPAS